MSSKFNVASRYAASIQNAMESRARQGGRDLYRQMSEGEKQADAEARIEAAFEEGFSEEAGRDDAAFPATEADKQKAEAVEANDSPVTDLPISIPRDDKVTADPLPQDA